MRHLRHPDLLLVTPRNPQAVRGGLRFLLGTALAAALAACAIGYDVDLHFTVGAEPETSSDLTGASLTWTVEERAIRLRVENRGPDVLRLRWDRAEFRDEHGQTHELIVADRLYGPYTRGVAAEIPGGSQLECVVWPADYAHLDVRSLLPGVRWSVARPLVAVTGITASDDREDIETRARQIVGTELTIELPIERAGRISEQRFVFTLTEVAARRARDVF